MIGPNRIPLVVGSLLALLATIVSGEWEDVILPPLEGKSGPMAVIYWAQGADIKTNQYQKIMEALQKELPFPLWVGIPQCIQNVCSIPTSLSKGIERIRESMEAQGMPSSGNKVFYGGHSLGGAMMPDYVAKSAEDADGMVLMGSFLTRKYKTGSTPDGRPQVEFPVPSLTIGGELDGLCRVTRIAENLYTQVTFSADPDAATAYMPVTVVPGMNHMEFASGDIPKFVLDNDLQPDISEEEAQAQVVEDASAFMGSIIDPSNTAFLDQLTSRVRESTEFTQPIIDAFVMESYEQFLPPCYCETPDEYGAKAEYGTCVSQPNCTGGVEWTSQYSMAIMAGVTAPGTASEVDGLIINSTDSIHLVTEEDPSCHLPHIHGNPDSAANPGHGDTPPICDKPDGCTLDITTVTQHLYDNAGEVDIWRLHFSVDWADTGFLPIAAKELKTKLKSRQAVWEAVNLQNVSFDYTDKPTLEGGPADRCAEINQASIDWATSKLPEATRTRFEEYGQQMIIGPDLSTCIAGPCWIWDNLKWQEDDEANTVTIQSVWFGSQNSNPYPCGTDKKLPCVAGFHYCKILSPARALEWMYVDGLRNKLGTSQPPV